MVNPYRFLNNRNLHVYSSTGRALHLSPLLNYGQPQLGQAGGTPLTMRSGGRIGYQEGGMGMTQLGAPQEEPIFPRLETLNENLGQAEQRLGSPSNNQFNISPMTSAFTGRPQMNLGGRMGYQEGGMDQMMPQDQAMMQPQQTATNMQPPLHRNGRTTTRYERSTTSFRTYYSNVSCSGNTS
jgi:hypothetical protein